MGDNLNIRSAVKERLKGSSKADLVSAINEASKDELTLPGLGVLFEMYYSSIPHDQKDSLLDYLTQLLN